MFFVFITEQKIICMLWYFQLSSKMNLTKYYRFQKLLKLWEIQLRVLSKEILIMTFENITDNLILYKISPNLIF